jgi:NAD(P)-dependent dehydrogenase (short-subunit alcohol dehydrogenase family)/acyl carrier protein
LIDLDPSKPANESASVISETVASGDGEDQVVWRDGQRYIPRLVKRRDFAGSGLKFKSDASYLLTGGLGALGLQVASRMVEAGARDLILLQRSQLPPRKGWAEIEGNRFAGQIAAIRELESKGARVHLFSVDVATEDQMDNVFREIARSLPPLRGVIHAAGFLDDGILAQMNQSRFDRVMAPKVNGAWNLHRLTLKQQLDFFVCFSSLAGLLGSPGQANYAAANAGLDSLVHYRRQLGLPALSINWGPWSEVGMAAADAKRGERVAQQGFGSVSPSQGVTVLQQLLQQDRAQVAVVAIDLKRLKQTISSAKVPMLSDLIGPTTAQPAVIEPVATPIQTREDKPTIRKFVTEADPVGRRRLLQDYLIEEMAKILQLPPSELHMNRPLNSLGIDSLMAVEIRNRIESDLPVRVQISTLLEGSSADDLVRNLLSQLQSESEKPADRAARVKQELNEMSDEAVRALLEAKRQEANRRRSSQ